MLFYPGLEYWDGLRNTYKKLRNFSKVFGFRLHPMNDKQNKILGYMKFMHSDGYSVQQIVEDALYVATATAVNMPGEKKIQRESLIREIEKNLTDYDKSTLFIDILRGEEKKTILIKDPILLAEYEEFVRDVKKEQEARRRGIRPIRERPGVPEVSEETFPIQDAEREQIANWLYG